MKQMIKESSLALLGTRIGLRLSAILVVDLKASSFRYTTLYCHPYISKYTQKLTRCRELSVDV
jgi:hypothetical protein